MVTSVGGVTVVPGRSPAVPRFGLRSAGLGLVRLVGWPVASRVASVRLEDTEPAVDEFREFSRGFGGQPKLALMMPQGRPDTCSHQLLWLYRICVSGLGSLEHLLILVEDCADDELLGRKWKLVSFELKYGRWPSANFTLAEERLGQALGLLNQCDRLYASATEDLRRQFNLAFYSGLQVDENGVRRADLNSPFAELIDRSIGLEGGDTSGPEESGVPPEASYARALPRGLSVAGRADAVLRKREIARERATDTPVISRSRCST